MNLCSKNSVIILSTFEVYLFEVPIRIFINFFQLIISKEQNHGPNLVSAGAFETSLFYLFRNCYVSSHQFERWLPLFSLRCFSRISFNDHPCCFLSCFPGSKAVDALLESNFAKTVKGKPPLFSKREEVVWFLNEWVWLLEVIKYFAWWHKFEENRLLQLNHAVYSKSFWEFLSSER